MSHPTRGSCVDPACPMHGRCHDGCGAKTKINKQTDYKRGYRKGTPYMYLAGHSPASRGALKPTTPRTARLVLLRRIDKNVPIQTIRPMAMWLISRYGVDAAADEVGISRGTFNNIAYRKSHVFVQVRAARKIVDAVLRARQGNRVLPVMEDSRVDLRFDEQVPSAPLRIALRQYLTGEGIPIKTIQTWYAERFGAELRTGIRHWKIVQHEDMTPFTVADRWCVLIGMPFDYVYAEEAS